MFACVFAVCFSDAPPRHSAGGAKGRERRAGGEAAQTAAKGGHPAIHSVAPESVSEVTEKAPIAAKRAVSRQKPAIPHPAVFAGPADDAQAGSQQGLRTGPCPQTVQ
jgi:hypothetical protein